jgi:hypothetical protein
MLSKRSPVQGESECGKDKGLDLETAYKVLIEAFVRSYIGDDEIGNEDLSTE